MQLKNVCLYAKGWYKKSDDIFSDLMRCLEGDGYVPGTKMDIVEIIMNSVISWLKTQQNTQFNSTSSILNDVDPQQVWKFGYYTRGNDPYGFVTEQTKQQNLPEWDYWTAVTHVLLSRLRYVDKEQLGGLPEPNYDILPASQSAVTKIKMELD